MDARGGGGHLLASDQGGSPLNSSHQGFILFVCRDNHVQDIFELSMILATHSQCNLASLDVFEDDIPEVTNIRQITYRKRMQQTMSYSSPSQVHERLQKDLAAISSLVKGRGGEYDYLDPENVACSIDI